MTKSNFLAERLPRPHAAHDLAVSHGNDTLQGGGRAAVPARSPSNVP
jgi:hypothetical protein